MGKPKAPVTIPPTIINVFKPARMTSYDVIRHFKRNLPTGFGKIGHFGTLDPFACGVLLIGVGGAARLNDYVHAHAPKTYLAIGKLGVETATGDLTEAPTQVDESVYLKNTIAAFDSNFIQEQLRANFLGDYWQSPHKYSAAKFEGKPLHYWARNGVEVHKEKVLRQVLEIEVVKYQFPYLSVRVSVSSGTYVRTLFSDFAAHLGTLGTLVSLVREKVGLSTAQESLKMKDWPQDKKFSYEQGCLRPDQLLPFLQVELGSKHSKLFANGVTLGHHQFQCEKSGLVWVYGEDEKLLGLGKIAEPGLKAQVNFAASSS